MMAEDCHPIPSPDDSQLPISHDPDCGWIIKVTDPRTGEEYNIPLSDLQEWINTVSCSLDFEWIGDESTAYCEQVDGSEPTTTTAATTTVIHYTATSRNVSPLASVLIDSIKEQATGVPFDVQIITGSSVTIAAVAIRAEDTVRIRVYNKGTGVLKTGNTGVGSVTITFFPDAASSYWIDIELIANGTTSTLAPPSSTTTVATTTSTTTVATTTSSTTTQTSTTTVGTTTQTTTTNAAQFEWIGEDSTAYCEQMTDYEWIGEEPTAVCQQSENVAYEWIGEEATAECEETVQYGWRVKPGSQYCLQLGDPMMSHI